MEPFVSTGWGKRSVCVFLVGGGTDEHWLTEPVIVDLVDKYIQIKNSINIICSFTKKR